MNIFNSLGSNYTAGFVSRSLFGLNSSKAQGQLKQKLGDHYDSGEVILTYKGRIALELALKRSGLPPSSHIGINGFTCFVVYDAVQRAGYLPVFIDVGYDGLNFELAGLEDAGYDLKAIVVQNTLGLPADIGPIEKYCRQHGILMIEDLAHSLGAVYPDGREAGKVGDLVMLSFSQDKPLDVVAGGALIDRRQPTTTEHLPKISLGQRLLNRTYPFWSSLIRHTYPAGAGRFLHAGLKKLHLLATPMGVDFEKPYAMTHRAATLLNGLWDGMAKEAGHRRKIAGIYRSNLPKDIQFKEIRGSKPFYLRFPIVVDDRPGLITRLKQSGVHIGDTWYDTPIGPKQYFGQTNYQTGQCPNAEKLAATIVNLPTHINVSEAEALSITQEVNQWLSQK